MNSDNWFSFTEEDNWLENEVLEAAVGHTERSMSPACTLFDADITMPAGTDTPTSWHMELYNSSITCHISPYCNDFKSFANIPPKLFTAVNKQVFSAAGMGNMVVEMLNGCKFSHLHLTKVLYSKEVGYMLMSISHLDELGLSTTSTDGFGTIQGIDGKMIGHIQWSTKGLYHVVGDHDTANIAIEQLTIMELHSHFGHVAPSVAWQLTEWGLVSSLVFNNLTGEGTFANHVFMVKQYTSWSQSSARGSVPRMLVSLSSPMFGD